MIGVLTGLVTKTSGRVIIDGVDIDDDPYRSRLSLGVVPQEINLNLFEKPWPILINQAGYFGISRHRASEKAEELLEQLGLWEKRFDQVRSLSGGMKRRLMIARALIHSPSLLLLDEPTAGVDVDLRLSTWEYLSRLNKQGVTILLTSHYLEEIEQLCFHAAMIQKGLIVKMDSLSNLVRSLDQQIYTIRVAVDCEEHYLAGIAQKLDHGLWEVSLSDGMTISQLIIDLDKVGVVVQEICPKRSRLEQLFLNINRSA